MSSALPHQEYTTRRAARAQSAAAAQRRYSWVSNLRLAVFVAMLAVAWFGLRQGPWGVLRAAPLLGVFIGLVVWHSRVAAALRRANAAVAHYDAGLDRLGDTWMGKGKQTLAFMPDAHPYASDLDLFGRGSLFELLATGASGAGDRVLARWLLGPAAREEIVARQAAVRAWTQALDLREALAVAGGGANDGGDPDALRAWAEAKPTAYPAFAPWLVRGAATVSGAALLGWAFIDGIGAPHFFIAVLPVLALSVWMLPMTRAVTHGLAKPLAELRALHAVMATFEAHNQAARAADAPWLSLRLGALLQGERSAAQAMRRLTRLVDWYESHRNQLFAPFALALAWATNFAFLIEAWRRRHGADVGRWIDAAAELEALAALSQYAYEHPDDVYPMLVGDGPTVRATGLGHPLLPLRSCVRNDVALGGPGPALLMVSGSNMSGKSTLMRALGCNVVLALSGAPVRCRELTLSVLALGCSIRVQDSLQEGASRFYAEITRLKQVVDVTERGQATLFLLDEILSGTNSHDRRTGTDAVVRSLIERGAIGIVTTHDLALTDIATSLGDKARNVHFADTVEGTRFSFDYTMRDGVVQRSNAILLMRAVGLPV